VGLVQHKKNILIRELETLGDLTFLQFPEHFLFLKLSNKKTKNKPFKQSAESMLLF